MRSTARRIGQHLLPLLILAITLPIGGCLPRRVADHEQWAPEERIILTFSHVVAEHTPKGLAARKFADLVHERTGGRVEVQVFPNGQLVGDGEAEIRALREGRVDMIAPSTGKLAELFPEWQVFDLPYVFADHDAVVQAMEGAIGERLFKVLRRRGLMGLTMWDNGFKQMTSAVRPLIHPEDFAGQRFRVQPSRVLVEQFRLLGATGLTIGFDETYRALEVGQVDGQENTPSNIYSKKFHEVQRYMTLSNHGYLGYVVIVDADRWRNLDEEVREVLTWALEEATRWNRENAGRLNAEDLERIRASGHVEIHEQTPEERAEWAEALRPVFDSFLTTVDDAELKLALEELKRAGSPVPGNP
ncbi:C4-dicarboxylate-binding protein DctP [Symbiobacterium terraclitae]|uniref:C4-dicarboxylate-binding protein DctP n=2 Tax=Symbiobacterium terraclitae TaxID=557451 RepID=A0ABS4JRG5_9FIRM|nr:TRAP transporter substrate-binding protein [Symbiobacterium terraclitae]MBP2018129.1 C4-dicarboxylate-binding protein DctP [Symbiobacterium terraclitae]